MKLSEINNNPLAREWEEWYSNLPEDKKRKIDEQDAYLSYISNMQYNPDGVKKYLDELLAVPRARDEFIDEITRSWTSSKRWQWMVDVRGVKENFRGVVLWCD